MSASVCSLPKPIAGSQRGGGRGGGGGGGGGGGRGSEDAGDPHPLEASVFGAFGPLSCSPQLDSFLPDECAEHCLQCKAAFTKTLRKHHCRVCQKIYCSNCSSHSSVIPPFLRPHDEDAEDALDAKRKPRQPTSAAQWGSGRKPGGGGKKQSSSSILSPGKGKPQRVCDECHHRIRQFVHAAPHVEKLSAVTLDQWKTLAFRSPHHATAVQFLQERLTRISQRFFQSTEQHRQFDVTLLRRNCHLLRGHSRYDIRMAQAGVVVPDGYEEDPEAGTIRPSKDRLPCADVMCAGCSEDWPLTHCVHAIHTLSSKHVLHKYAIQRIRQLFMADPAVLEPFLPTLAWQTTTCPPLLEALVSMFTTHIPSAVHCYWYCRAHPLLYNLQSAVHRSLSQQWKAEISATSEWVNCFESAASNFKDVTLTERCAACARERQPLLPGSVDTRVVDVDVEKRKQLSSYTRPVLMEVQVVSVSPPTHDSPEPGTVATTEDAEQEAAPQEKRLLLYKSENVDADAAINRVHRLLAMHPAIQRAGIPVPVYGVVPLTAYSGIIMFLPDVITFAELKQEGENVMGYLLKFSRHLRMGDVADRFTRSCAYSGMVSYALGFGDRHLANMLLTPNSEIVHVDFSFLFGNESRSFRRIFKIRGIPVTTEINQLLKHQNDMFLRECMRVSGVLSAEAEAIYWCLWPLIQTTALTKADLKRYFLTHVIGISQLNRAEIQAAVVSLVNHSTSNPHSLAQRFVDFAHDAAIFFRDNSS